MAVKQHFRIIEVDQRQVLLERASSDEDREYVEVVTHLGDLGIRASYKLSFGEDVALADKCLVEFTEDQAKDILASMDSMLAPEEEKEEEA